MAQPISTSLIVQFGDDNGEGALRWEEDPDRVPEDESEIYLRLYPAHTETILVTSGALTRKGEDTHHVEEALFFAGTRSVSPQYSVLNNLTTEVVGTFFQTDGTPKKIRVKYDSTRNEFVADEECYGLVKAEYDTPYQSYLFGFSGKACQTVWTVDGFTHIGGYKESTIVAIDFNPDGNATATITLTPPECGVDEVLTRRDDEAKLPTLKFLVHEDWPARMTDVDINDEPLSAMCKVKQIPAVNAQVFVSNAVIKREDGVHKEEVEDIVTFNGSGSVNMEYQPGGVPKVTVVSGFYNLYGTRFTPSFALPGETVYEVEWLSEDNYRGIRARKVLEDELVAVTSGMKVVPVFGSVRLEYSIDYFTYSVHFILQNPNLPEDGWEVAHLIGFYGEQTAQLALDPPTMRET